MPEAITIELLHEDSRAPERATEDSAGYDLFVHLTQRTLSCTDTISVWDEATRQNGAGQAAFFELAPHTTAKVPLGFKAKLPRGLEAQIRPRSGTTFKKGLTIPNAPGTIDADYPDEWMVLVRNTGPRPVRIDHGERIAQMVLARYEVLPIAFGTVARSTARAGGFGSTGA